jgi:cytochrome c-type biogenesis protein CcmF
VIAELGAFAGALALVLALAQGGLGLAGGHRNDPRLSAAGAAAAQAALIALAAAFAALTAAFVRSDFSLAVVVNNSNTMKPLIYKIAGVWGNHEGSMLLWCLIAAAFGAVMAQLRGGLSHGTWSRAVGVQGLVTAAALAYTLVLSSPFTRLDPAPMQGGDLVAFMSAGAYGAAMSSEYNSRPLVPEVLVSGDRFAVIRRRPTYEEMLADESPAGWL